MARVLVACEFSGVVRDAFAARGHHAVSADLLPTERPGLHYEAPVQLLARRRWDVVIAFPPCTTLCRAGARWYSGSREQRKSLDFIRWLMDWDVPRMAIENPKGAISSHIRKPDQILQPWQFGHGETKTTCLWLKGLPPLQPTNIVAGREPRVHRAEPGPDRWKERSRTLPGIAQAMAQQWGDLLGDRRSSAAHNRRSQA